MGNEKRTTPSVSLKPKERKWLEQKAKEAGVSLGRYMRQVALGERSQDGEKQGEDHRRKQILKELSSIGNNINQIAKKANETGAINPARIDEVREELNKITAAVLGVKL